MGDDQLQFSERSQMERAPADQFKSSIIRRVAIQGFADNIHIFLTFEVSAPVTAPFPFLEEISFRNGRSRLHSLGRSHRALFNERKHGGNLESLRFAQFNEIQLGLAPPAMRGQTKQGSLADVERSPHLLRRRQRSIPREFADVFVGPELCFQLPHAANQWPTEEPLLRTVSATNAD